MIIRQLKVKECNQVAAKNTLEITSATVGYENEKSKKLFQQNI